MQVGKLSSSPWNQSDWGY